MRYLVVECHSDKAEELENSLSILLDKKKFGVKISELQEYQIELLKQKSLEKHLEESFL